ncbi:NADH-quinone oxidoreductase subunit G [Escherichia coli]|uniref:NADH-quinone oxidoreductase subunit G n=1 Tax=Escherichia coli TaxID=562 RepID=A0A2X1N4Q4_ECOLX|nr:NADH-quinone oxidoreductase subunit G [Escherichia coli]
MRANISVHEPRQPQDIDTMFTFSMEGNNQPTAHRSQVPFAWAPGWNSPQAWNKFQDEVGGKLRFGDPGVRLFETSEMVWITSPAYRHASSRRTGNGVSRRITTCLAAMNCHSVLRSSRAVCRSRTSNSTQRMPRS